MSIKAEYIDHMGTDLTIVNAARVSFDKQSAFFEDRDKSLIQYLARNGHWTPFSHCMITLRETVPIPIARQRFKHKVGFTENEISRRYVDGPVFYFEPVWRKKHDSAKQGSAEAFDAYGQAALNDVYFDHIERCDNVYKHFLAMGVCPEQARFLLPQAAETSYYVTGSLQAFARAYKLRLDPHAQKEIRDLAVQWDKIIAPLFPVAWEVLKGN